MGAIRRAAADLHTLRPSGALVAGATALVLAAAAGWYLGDVSRDDVPASTPNAVADVGAMRLEIEPTWVRADSVPGLPVAGASILAPAPGLAERALLVTGAAADASLIPAALRAELPATLPRARRAALAGLPAWTYGPLRDEGRMVEVTVVPTTTGSVALACSTPAASWSAWLDCASDVHAVETGGAKALDPSAELAFRQAAGPVFAALDRKRVAARERLAEARPPAPAAALARAHREAAAALAPFAAPGAAADAVAALREAARAYDAFATAARNRRALTRPGSRARARFISARRQVARAEAALAAALD